MFSITQLDSDLDSDVRLSWMRYCLSYFISDRAVTFTNVLEATYKNKNFEFKLIR